MKESEYNSYLTELSYRAFNINQLLFEILVIISIYIFINRLRILTLPKPLSASISKNSKSIIILWSIFAIVLDWFIWNNLSQTLLFICIIVIYINYNINNLEIISSFINLTKEYNDAAEYNDATDNDTSSSTMTIKQNCNQPSQVIPELVSLPYDPKLIKPFGIIPFDGNDMNTKELNEVYKAGKPYMTLTNNAYASKMINQLHKTPQYRDIKNIEINAYLEDDKYFLSPEYSYTNKDKYILDSLRNPTKEFLDMRWLQNNTKGTYNCNGLCSDSDMNNQRDNGNTSNRNKQDAICSLPTDPSLIIKSKQYPGLVFFGKPLEQCTNQDNTISQNQLDNISSNNIPSMDI
jgi:hypothetical protein